MMASAEARLRLSAGLGGGWDVWTASETTKMLKYHSWTTCKPACWATSKRPDGETAFDSTIGVTDRRVLDKYRF